MLIRIAHALLINNIIQYTITRYLGRLFMSKKRVNYLVYCPHSTARLLKKCKMAEPMKEEKSPKKSNEKLEGHFLVPSPIPTRRTRTTSQSRLASDSPLQTGQCKSFCRNRGHGFITPDEGDRDIFVHISDIEGELVLKAGDKVTYRTVPLPMKPKEKQAVEVVITAANGPHDTWSPLSHSAMSIH